MAVSIKAKFTNAGIRKVIAEKKKAIEQAILSRLQRVAERFVSNARTFGNYKDQTGNLRSSIGYVILKDGKQLSSSFEGSQPAGRAKAQEAIKASGAYGARGFVLIVVAGMEYAAAVESKGYDVLTASSILAKDQLEKAMQELKDKVKRMK